MPKKITLKKGIFITLEGVEGCGKTTQARMLFRFLKKDYDCVFTREPGGTAIGEQIRKVLLDPKNKGMSKETELLLFQANRSQIVKEVILPALRKKRIVLSDRFYDATTAYQGYANRMNIDFVKRLNMFAGSGLKPDLTIILDIDAKTGLKRALNVGKKDRMESKRLLYHRRVRSGYRRIADQEPRRVKIVRTKRKIADTQVIIRREVTHVIRKYES